MSQNSLSDVFCAALPDQQRELSAIADLEVLLKDIIRSAQSAWPMVHLGDEVFVGYLAARLPADKHPRDALIQVKSDDLYLACACSRGDGAANRAFEDAYVSELHAAIPPLDNAPVSCDEVVQQVRTKLLTPSGERPPKIADYAGRGTLRSWVRVVAVREAISLCRPRAAEIPTDERLLDEVQQAQGDDPELLHLKKKYKTEFKVCFEKAFSELSRKERNLLRQHLLDGLSIDQLGPIYRVHRATVARWLQAAREKVIDQTREALRQKLSMGEEEFRSIIKLVRSQLDLSLHRLLKEDPPERES